MLQRANRFHGRRSVASIRGFLVHTNHFSFRAGKSKIATYRVAVVVSKKVASSAVDRNRIRRRVFEVVRTQHRLNGSSLDLIIYVKDASIKDIDWQTLGDEIAHGTKKVLAGLSRPKPKAH